jgi:hypothetical protein
VGERGWGKSLSVIATIFATIFAIIFVVIFAIAVANTGASGSSFRADSRVAIRSSGLKAGDNGSEREGEGW